MTLTLKEARVIIDTASKTALDMGHTVAIAVVDTSGRVISLDRFDGAMLYRERMAVAKATAAVLTNAPSAELKNMSRDDPARYQSLLAMFPGEIYGSGGGGLPLRNAEGELLGGVGVAGAPVGTDDPIGQAGIDAWRS